MSNSTAYIPSIADKSFPICFAVVLLVTLFQIIRIIRLLLLDTRKRGRLHSSFDDGCSCHVNPILTMHLLILIVCILQLMLELYYLNLWPSLPSYGIPILGALPFIFMFWIFTTLIFQWATIVQFPFDDINQTKRRMRPLLFLANLIVTIQEILFMYFAIKHPNEPVLDAYNIFDNSMMAFLYLVTGIAFLVYGSILSAHLQDARRSTSLRVHLMTCSVTCRIQFSALLIFILLIGESIIWSLRIPKYKHTTWVELTSFNIASLCVILALFWKSVSSMEKDLERDKSTNSRSYSGKRPSSMPMSRLTGGGKSRNGRDSGGAGPYLTAPRDSGGYTPRSMVSATMDTSMPRSTMPTISVIAARDSEAFTDGVQNSQGSVLQGDSTPPHLVVHPDPRITFGFPESSSMDIAPRLADPQELHGDL